jgi:four helix bundle protein
MIDDRFQIGSSRHRIIRLKNLRSVNRLFVDGSSICGAECFSSVSCAGHFGRKDTRHLDCSHLADVSKADELQKRTEAFADVSIEFLTGLPETPLVRRMAGQYQNASTSIGANYRAARRAKSHADFVSKIGTVSEEADESLYWLQRMFKADIRSATIGIETLLSEAEELARIFGASHRTAKRRRGR